MSWTRFHLPQEQEWPMWSVNHDDVHAGPLVDVQGCRKLSLGRMVDNPEQAVYIIGECCYLNWARLHVSKLTLLSNCLEWVTLDDLKNFQSSPACAEFLQNLPEYDNSQISIEPGLTLRHLALNDSSSSLTPASSRFLTFQHATQARTSEIENRVTITTFLIPRKVDNLFKMWYDEFQGKLSKFIPGGSELVTKAYRFPP